MAKRRAVNFGSSGRADTYVATTLARPGDQGGVYEEGTDVWQIVQLSPLALVAGAGGDVVYWVNRAQYIVTTNILASAADEVAGVIPAGHPGVPIGSFFAVKVGGNETVNSEAVVHALGTPVIAFAGAGNTCTLRTAATSVEQLIGRAQGPVAAGVVPVFLTLGPI